MQPVRIVEAFDVVDNSIHGRSPRWPGLAMDELGLERGEEALGDGVRMP